MHFMKYKREGLRNFVETFLKGNKIKFFFFFLS
jgi:hypothetical protein